MGKIHCVFSFMPVSVNVKDFLIFGIVFRKTKIGRNSFC